MHLVKGGRSLPSQGWGGSLPRVGTASLSHCRGGWFSPGTDTPQVTPPPAAAPPTVTADREPPASLHWHAAVLSQNSPSSPVLRAAMPVVCPEADLSYVNQHSARSHPVLYLDHRQGSLDGAESPEVPLASRASFQEFHVSYRPTEWVHPSPEPWPPGQQPGTLASYKDRGTGHGFSPTLRAHLGWTMRGIRQKKMG